MNQQELTQALLTWLPAQRWFAGKHLDLREVRLRRMVELHPGDPAMLLAVITADAGGGDQDDYQLLLGRRSQLPEGLEHAAVDTQYYDATHDPELTHHLLEFIAHDVERGGIRFTPEPGAVIDVGVRSRPVGTEQTHTSLIYGQTYILKLFRKLSGGSRDLEVLRALARVNSEYVATPLGAIEDEHATYGMLTDYVPNAADGWAMATASVRDLLASDVDHPELTGGDFAAEAYRLGQTVAAVHTDLAKALGTHTATDDDLRAIAAHLHRRLDKVLATVPALRDVEPAVRGVYEQVTTLATRLRPPQLQAIHGDLHLGQVLRSVDGWQLIDFEGEPDALLTERCSATSPLRDVAGMVRSFDYAAQHLLGGEFDSERYPTLAERWSARNQTAFCEGYAATSSDPRAHGILLQAFELDKAVYEVGYEQANRPQWLPIPLGAIHRLTKHEVLDTWTP